MINEAAMPLEFSSNNSIRDHAGKGFVKYLILKWEIKGEIQHLPLYTQTQSASRAFCGATWYS